MRSKRKKEHLSVLTGMALIAVALGVASLGVTIAITTGFQEAFKEKVLGVNAHVLVLKYGIDFHEYRDVMQTARRIRGVKVAPFVIEQMMLAHGDALSGVLLKGVDPNLVGTVLDLPSHMVKGSLDGLRIEGTTPPEPRRRRRGRRPGEDDDDLDSFLSKIAKGGAIERHPDAGPDEGPSPEAEELRAEVLGRSVPRVEPGSPEAFGKKPSIVLGRELARKLGAKMGSTVRVISPLAALDSSLWSASENTPKERDFIVTGIFHAGFEEYDSHLVYVDLYEAQRFFDQGDAVTGVEIRLPDMDDARSVSRRLRRALGDGPYQVIDWEELNRNLFTALRLQKLGLSLALTLISGVAAFFVLAMLIKVVLDKKREIAILKAMGARQGAIVRIFLFQGAMIGFAGAAAGVALGLGVCLLLQRYGFPLDPKVYFIDKLPVVVRPGDFLIAAGVASGLCLGAGLIPSWWAARLSPIDGLRYE